MQRTLTTKNSYIVFISAIGSALEYYSFIIYIMLATYLGELFFPRSSSAAALLYTLLLFAVSYAVMPLSAIGFGFIADRVGRKKVMVMAITIMASATLAIGLLPTYKSIGITATVLLFMLRLVQGLAQGAELPGAITFLSEHAQSKNQGLLCGVLFFAVGSGALLSTLVNYLLTNFLTKEQMLAYGWRLPFLLAGLLGIVGWKIRKKTTETPLFLAQSKLEIVRVPFFTLIKHYFPKILIGLGLVGSGAVLVNFGIFIPTFLQTHFNYLPRDTYLVTTFGFAIDFLLIIFGFIADKITFKRFYLIGVSVAIIALYPIFLLLKIHSLTALFFFVFLYHFLILPLAACYPAMIARLFPTKVRYSGVAISYVGAYSIAGFAPLIINSLYNYFANNILAVIFSLLIPLLIGCCAALFYRDSKLLN